MSKKKLTKESGFDKKLTKEVIQAKNYQEKQTGDTDHKVFEEKLIIKNEKSGNSLKSITQNGKASALTLNKVNNQGKAKEYFSSSSSDEEKPHGQKSDHEIFKPVNEYHTYSKQEDIPYSKHVKIAKKESFPLSEEKTKASTQKPFTNINFKSSETVLQNHIIDRHHEESEETITHEALQNLNINDHQRKCSFKMKSEESERFSELLNYIKNKQIQVIPIQKVLNEGKILGEGGFGVVYEGEWENSKVAVKEMFISYDEFKVMDSELDFMGKYRNPRLVTLYGIYIKEIRANKLQCGFIMELMNIDLDNYLYNEPKADKSLKNKIRIIIQITKGINYLHSIGIVHRDIKPKNVLLTESGDAKLTDLGIAKVLENKEKTESATIAFTARYASREAALENITSFCNDIWSFGVMMYEILTEKKPWGNLNNPKILIYLNNMEDPFEKGWEKGFDKEIYDIVMKCTKYDYKERMASKEILIDLIEYEKKFQCGIKI